MTIQQQTIRWDRAFHIIAAQHSIVCAIDQNHINRKLISKSRIKWIRNGNNFYENDVLEFCLSITSQVADDD